MVKCGIIIYFLSILTLSNSFGQTKKSYFNNLLNKTTYFSLLDSIIPKIMDSSDLTGLSIAIIKKGKIIYSKGFGKSDNNSRKSITDSTIFEAASLTKPLFAFTVMRLQERRLIDIDKPLYQYLEYNDIKNDPRHKKITARMVLSHTTGFPNWREMNPDQKLDIKFDPGSSFQYSGEGYVYLQKVIKKITNQNLQEIISKWTFEPLGMNNSSLVWENNFERNFAFPHDSKQKIMYKDKPSNPMAAGTLHISVYDFGKFITTLQKLDKLKKKTYSKMFSPQTEIKYKRMFGTAETTDEFKFKNISWGLGWGIFNSTYGKAIFHTGHNPGFHHYTVNFLEKEIGLILMSNSENFPNVVHNLANVCIGDTCSPFKWIGYNVYNDMFGKEKHKFADKKILAEITNVVNDETIEVDFSIEEDKEVIVYAIAESTHLIKELPLSMFDYALIVDEENREIWKINVNETEHAGGSLKNRVSEKRIHLKKGNYKLKYFSDNGHAYNNWNDTPPEIPLYGVQIFEP